jgi:hypothetical protein
MAENMKRESQGLSLALGEAKTYFESVPFVFLVDVLNEGLEVF